MVEHTFTDPLYDAGITYLIGGTVEELIEFIKSKHGDAPKYSWSERFEWREDSNITNGYQFHINAPQGDEDGEGEVFYVWVHKPTPSLLFHETFHLVGDILHTRGIVYCANSEEAFAYLGGWIFQEIHHLML